MKKTHVNFPKTLTNSSYLLKYGSCGFKVITNTRITAEQLLILKQSLLKRLKSLCFSKNYKVWSFIFPNKTLTKLSLESRMGKGKGTIYTEVIFLKKGFIIYEFQNINNLQIKDIFSFFKKHFPGKLLLVFKK